MSQPSSPKTVEDIKENEKVPFLVVKRIREAILDEVFKPGDHLGEVELAGKFEVSRSPVREALLALEKEGTVVISPYKGAIVKSLSGRRSFGDCGTQVGLHLSGAQTGVPPPLPGRL